MEWINRGASQDQPSNQPASPVGHTGSSAHSTSGGSKNKSKYAPGFPGFSFVLLMAVTLLLVSLVSYVSFSPKPIFGENKYVDSSKFQAIFLNGGQVYFGKILSLNDKFVRANNIYYLKVDQKVQPNQSTATTSDVTLVKLGCELHGPQDQMLINRDQVVFWENLKSDGQVAKAVAEFVKANPTGQKCDTPTTNSSTTPTTTKTTP